ncbi:MAG: hypothetical protein V4638_06365 [Bacteroidota bacterium]
MQNLIVVLVTSIFFGSISIAQNKYQRKNETAEVLKYAEGNLYSRSLIVRGNSLFIANSNGTLYKYDLLAGTSINMMENKKFEEMRDLALVNDTLYGMQSGSYGILAQFTLDKFKQYILPSGNIWHKVFLDGMDFHHNIGFIMGDPVDGFFKLSYSLDAGRSWKACDGKVESFEDEAGFAASGTNVQVLNDSTFLFVSGGKKSRFFISSDRGNTWKSTSLPYLTSISSGAFSIHMQDAVNGVLVGGDYANPDLNMNCAYYTDDGGEFWMNAEQQPRGYRSCVILAEKYYYSCGTNGIDVSFDNGVEWIPFADGNFFSMCNDKEKLYATMKNGEIKVFDLLKKK